MKRIWMAALAGLMLFTGCRGSLPGMENNREKETAAPVKLTEVFENYQVYEQIIVPMPEDCREGRTLQQFYCTEEGFAGTYYTDAGKKWAEYDWDGTLLRTTELLSYDNLLVMSSYLTLDGDKALVVNNYFPEDRTILTGELCLLHDTDGVLGTYTFASHFAQPPKILELEDRYLLMDYNTDTLWVFDHGLEMIGSFTLAYSPDILYPGTDGTLYCQAYDGLVYTINPENGYMEPVLPHSANTTYLQYPGRENDLYAYTADGFYRMMQAEDGSFGEPELLLDWNTSGLDYQKIDIQYIADPHTLLCMSGNNLDNRDNLVLLRRVPDDQVPERKIVNLLAAKYQDVEILQRLAAEFNLENKEYYVHVEIMDSLLVDETEKMVYGRLQEGNVPDLLCMHSYMDDLYMNLLKQGYLVDLRDLTEPLTGSAEAAVQYGDTCGRIPLFIRYHTLLSAKVTEPLTAESLLACRDRGTLFTTSQRGDLRDVMQNVFIDPDSGKCSFDSTLFRSYLELIRDLDSLTDYRLGRIDANLGLGEMHYSLIGSSLPETLREGEPMFLQMPLYTIGAWTVNKVIWGETDFTVCGYPDTMALPRLDYSLAVFRDGGCTEGAKAFLEFVLSDTVQTSECISRSAMPVTSSALEILLEKDWFQVHLSGVESYNDYMAQVYTGSTIKTDQTLLGISDISRTEPEITEGNRTVYDDKIRNIRLTGEDKAQICALLEDEGCGRVGDPTVDAILSEEIGAFLSGDRSMEDTVRVLQSRVGTYLAEIQ